ncbi:hypothetical protein [Winogradskyella sp. PE311]|uniref:hypothetical protein n=1 Tax=Winogradskyella sp. PE311 TaxID=3366943 RepID=UPI00397EB10B
MKLTPEKIKIVDDFLINQNIKYLDIRSELLDHLVTEFEEHSNYGLLEDYLHGKIKFIKEFAKKQQKTIHWTYQKQLWVQFAKFFFELKYILLLAVLISLGYVLLQYVTLKTFTFVCFFFLAALVLYPLFYQIKYSKAVKKVQSMQSLFTVTSLPSVFLYMFNVVNDILIENFVLGLIYFSFAIVLGISAVIIIEKDRKRVLKKYYQLIG